MGSWVLLSEIQTGAANDIKCSIIINDFDGHTVANNACDMMKNLKKWGVWNNIVGNYTYFLRDRDSLLAQCNAGCEVRSGSRII